MTNLNVPPMPDFTLIGKAHPLDNVDPANPKDRVARTEGLRYNEGKARYDLIPADILHELALHYGRGAKKYSDRNWELGMKWCICFGALMRHAWAWMRGEDYDEETGSHHMIAVAWNAIAIATYAKRHVGTDDRPLGDERGEITP